MPSNEEIFKKLDDVQLDIKQHGEKSSAFQEEVMTILKGSFEGGKWVPGMAPLLKEQVGRIDRIEEKQREETKNQMTWKHGVGFSIIGGLISQFFNNLHFK